MRFRRHELHTMTGCYALDALDVIEREEFERHLSRCQPCAAEVRSLRATAAQLGLAAAAPPPARMRLHVMTAASTTRQLPPPVSRPPRRLRPRGQVTWLTAAAVSTAAAIILGLTQGHTGQQLTQAQARDQAVAAILAAPDARITSTATSAGGDITTVVSIAQRQIIVVAAGLPALPAARTYEVWLISPATAPRATTRPAGLIPAGSGSGPVTLTAQIIPGYRIGITVEPSGGSPHPTTAPIMTMALPA